MFRAPRWKRLILKAFFLGRFPFTPAYMPLVSRYKKKLAEFTIHFKYLY